MPLRERDQQPIQTPRRQHRIQAAMMMKNLPTTCGIGTTPLTKHA
jgi:hypothetical protein